MASGSSGFHQGCLRLLLNLTFLLLRERQVGKEWVDETIVGCVKNARICGMNSSRSQSGLAASISQSK